MTLATISRAPAPAPQTGREARLAIRARAVRGQTAGRAPGFVQGNLAILPGNLAGDFLRFCQLNPKPCPLLAASAPGDFRLPTLAAARARRYDSRARRCAGRARARRALLVFCLRGRVFFFSLVLGCSFSFEEAL